MVSGSGRLRLVGAGWWLRARDGRVAGLSHDLRRCQFLRSEGGHAQLKSDLRRERVYEMLCKVRYNFVLSIIF